MLFVYHFISDGDFSFLLTLGSITRAFGFFILFAYLRKNKKSSGVSLKSLELYCLVFVGRLSSILIYDGYLPFDSSGDWLYQSVEIVALSFCILSIISILNMDQSYSFTEDSFAHLKQIPPELGPIVIILPVMVLAVLFKPSLNNNFLTDTMWTFGSYLETVAILPQFYLLQKLNKPIEGWISHFVFSIGLSRLFLFVFWAASFHELHDRRIHTILDGFEGWLILFVQIAHLAIMGEFCFYYIVAAKEEKPLIIPNLDV